MYDIDKKTIAAVSTPYGRGAIAVIRVSGARAVEISSHVFVPRRRMRLSACEQARGVYGVFMSGGEIIDDGVATVYFAPHSYTGEDVVELSCHGGILVTRLILQSLIDAGAYPAQGGEFTKRAFAAGKLSLSSAEAIMDIIDAKSTSALRLANGAGRGRLSSEAEEIYTCLRGVLASTYAYIDYPDEDLTDISVQEMSRRLRDVLERAQRLKATYKTSRAVTSGVATVICGKPNVGKSSLLNLFTGEQTAIVTETAGTTRDVVTGEVLCGQIVLKLADTAGIRRTDDRVEKIGVDRAVDRLMTSELILAVFDGSRELDEEDYSLISMLKRAAGEKLAVINKSDKEQLIDAAYIRSRFKSTVCISAKTAAGQKELFDTIQSLFINGAIDYDAPHITNERQYWEISHCADSIKDALAALESGLTQDVASFDIERAIACVARLDGRQITDGVVDEIFSKFCVGK